MIRKTCKNFAKLSISIVVGWVISECIITLLLFNKYLWLWYILSLLFVFGFIISFILIGCIFKSKDVDKTIAVLRFEKIDDGMTMLQEVWPNIFSNGDYKNMYVLNAYNDHYYEIYKKDEIKWMRDIGTKNPIEGDIYE